MSLTPRFLAKSDGDPFWILEANLIVKFSSEETGGAFTMLELSAPKGMDIAPHTHSREDEIFVVTTGSFEIFCGESSWQMEQGDSIFLPRGVPHWFRVTSDDFRAVEITIPGGYEDMLAELSEITREPRTSLTFEQMALAMAVGRKHGHFFGPNVPESADSAAEPHHHQPGELT
jgi:quercetin dioxygenase-like cupin family protein